jgi:uroporphyrinogen III methyltransferase / synthase
MKMVGTVYLVGAGPGDAGLLTLRGAELLRRSDVVIYDTLVNRDLLRLARPSAVQVCRGKSSSAEALSQAEMTALMIGQAKEGKCVVRLKGGDPYVFGRGGEEAEALAEAGIPFEVVPGISSVVACPNYAGIPLTHRDHCSSFTVITGHGDPEAEPTSQEWDQLAGIPGTKVVLMGTQRLRDWTAALIARGVAAQTPVAVVQWGTTGRQQSVVGTLDNIAARVADRQITPPALTIIGEVVKLRSKLNWFEHRPLFGQRVVVTRAVRQAGPLKEPLAELGADVLEVPCIKTGPTDNKTEIVEVMGSLGEYDWIVFTSTNGVNAFFDYFFRAFEDVRDLGALRIAAVGPGTAARLQELHLKVDVMPKAALGLSVAKALGAFESIENLKIVLMRAETANPDLPQALSAMGAIVDDVACYKTMPETEDFTGDAGRLLAEGAHWATFTSGSTVESFHARFDLPKLLARYPGMKLASIGPETTKAIEALGLKPAIEAREHTVEGLVKALLSTVRRH